MRSTYASNVVALLLGWILGTQVASAQDSIFSLPETIVETDSPATPEKPSTTSGSEDSIDTDAPAFDEPLMPLEPSDDRSRGPNAKGRMSPPAPSRSQSTSMGQAPSNGSMSGETSSSVSRATNLLNQAESASSGVYGQAELDFRSINRPGDVLEVIPGFIATQHSGTGKANQYFVRGINLDHGTDFALRVDDVPINLPSHGHGQGYLDVNWLIPELVQSVNYRLGPYYADIGDFSSAGTADIQLFRELPYGIASATDGSFGYTRALLADSQELSSGTLLYALETNFYDGPWDVPENFEKFNGLLRWSHGNQQMGVAISAQGYGSSWTATNQISARAFDAGLVGRFGSLDPSDGGSTSRAGLNAQYWSYGDDVTTKANVYVNYYSLDLFSNFTYFLDDPVNGDQIQQLDNRYYAGLNLSRTFHRDAADHTVGFQFRNDNIYNLALNHTSQRALVSQVRNDSVDQQDFALYYQNEVRFTDWMRSLSGIRGDLFRFHNRSDIVSADSNTTDAGVLSPKLGLVFGPWNDTELYTNWGQSFHSNDARGINASQNPASPLVKSEGSELGLRSFLTPSWNSTLALWYLEIDSELVFVGDAGTTEAGPSSHRGGITWTNYYQLTDWLTADFDYSHVRPRFDGGDRIPNAIENVINTGYTIHPAGTPWYTSFRVRHYGPAALVEDNSARSGTTTLANLQIGRQTQRTTFAVDVFNVFNRKDNDITYFYESAPAGLPAADDYHFHPIEPAMARTSFTWRF